MEQEQNWPSPQDVADIMLENDGFSKLLGLQLDEVREGYCRLHYTVRPDMLNGFSTVHGGVIFSAADSAFAFACNSPKNARDRRRAVESSGGHRDRSIKNGLHRVLGVVLREDWSRIRGSMPGPTWR